LREPKAERLQRAGRLEPLREDQEPEDRDQRVVAESSEETRRIEPAFRRRVRDELEYDQQRDEDPERGRFERNPVAGEQNERGDGQKQREKRVTVGHGV